MNEHDVKPDPPLTPEQALRFSAQAGRPVGDRPRASRAVRDHVAQGRAYRGMTIVELSERFPNIPDIYYAQRVRRLVAVGELESRQSRVHALQRSETAREVTPPEAG